MLSVKGFLKQFYMYLLLLLLLLEVIFFAYVQP
jgi:hypothetical protein